MSEAPGSNGNTNIAGESKQKRKRRARKKKASQKSKALVSQQPPLKPKGSNNNKKTQTIHLPHAKLTLRKIHNVEKCGTVEEMIGLLRELIHDRNQSKLKSETMSEESQMIAKVVTPLDIVLEEASVFKIFDRVKQNQMIEDQLEKQLQQQKEGKDEVANVESNGEQQVHHADTDMDIDIDNHNDNDSNQEQSPQQNVDTMEDQTTYKDKACANSDANSNTDEKKTAPNVKQTVNVISARLLYIIPPKKSRRRGELTGHCYLALYSPMPTFVQDKLKMIKDEEMVISKMLKEFDQAESLKRSGTEQEPPDVKPEICSNLQEQDIEGTVPATERDQSFVNLPQEIKTDALSPQSQTQQSDAASESTATIQDEKQQTKPEMHCQTKITAADRSKALAQSRLLLSETIASLANLCKDDSKKDYAGIHIELSPNQKIWKAEEKGNGSGKKFGMAAKYDSTIEQNEDFKQFVQSKMELKNELTNRPKPPLGGGPLAETMNSNVGGDDKTGGNGGDPVAAIVLHLREKKEAARKAKKKTNAEKKKTVKGIKSGGDKGRKGGKTDGEKSKKRSNRRKKGAKQGESIKKVGASVPKMLLKK